MGSVWSTLLLTASVARLCIIGAGHISVLLGLRMWAGHKRQGITIALLITWGWLLQGLLVVAFQKSLHGIRRQPGPSSVIAWARWLDNKVSIDVPCTAEEAYNLYSNLEEHPKWSPWLRSVEMIDKEERISQWTLSSKGIKVTWKARNTVEDRPNRIQWESITGLPNRGLVTFTQTETSPALTTIELTVSYSLPSAVAKVFSSFSWVQSYIERTLLADLTRYKTTLLKALREQRVRSSG